MAFFVELSQDEHGNRSHTNRFVCVIEADLKEDGSGIQSLHIIAPDEIRCQKPTIRVFPNQWVECEGPARMVSREERELIIARSVAAKGVGQ